MQMGFVLQQEQSQRLLMTTQMKQAIELLQCTQHELVEYMLEWVADNPVVELEIPSALANAATLRDSRFQKPSQPSRNGFPLEQTVQATRCMYDDLAGQLRVMDMPASMLKTALFLVGCLDESGYLTVPLEEIAGRFGSDATQVTAALRHVQACEPRGIGARNLSECLLLQLDAASSAHRELLEDIIREHLEDVAAGKLAHMAKVKKTSIATIQQAVDELKRMNPRPGLAYANAPQTYVTPDVIVHLVDDGYVVTTNYDAQPRLLFPSQYKEWLTGSDPETRSYVLRHVQSAEWLARCLEQRRLTLLRVAEAIVRIQEGFLNHGIAALRPLTLREIAAEIGVHESTVSRATRGKYILTPRGLFEMKYFFTSELQGADGTTSAEVAKHAIRKLVESEDAQHPFSDESLAKCLHQQGIHLSRRTVAKYREEMNLAPSWRRRRYSS